jgi:hypothetical protein
MSSLKQRLKKLCIAPYCAIKLVDEFLKNIYASFCDSYDKIIKDLDISEKLKVHINSRQILFYTFLISSFLLIELNLPSEYRNLEDYLETYLKWFFRMLIRLSFGALVVFVLLMKCVNFNAIYINRKEDLENYITEQRKDLLKNVCTACKIVKCMRSQHCELCNKCVSKFELHSFWLNICIGSQNCLFYILILAHLNFFLFFTMSFLFLQIFIKIFCDNSLIYDLSGNGEFVFHFWLLISFYMEVKLAYYTFEILKCVLKNITIYEHYNWKRTAYLWRSLQKEFFNPFDKGTIGNIRELVISFFNPQIRLSDKINLDLNTNCNLNDSELHIREDLSNSSLNLDTENQNLKEKHEKKIEQQNKSFCELGKFK